MEPVNLAGKLEYASEPAGTPAGGAALDQAESWNWKPHQGAGALSLSYQAKPVWVRFPLIHQGQKPETYVLELAWPLLQDVRVYIREGGGKEARRVGLGGLLRKEADSTLRHRSEVFPLQLDAGEQLTVYLRIHTDGTLIAPLHLWSEASFHHHDRQVSLLLGLFFGAMGVMLLYNLSLALITREPAYLAYVAFVASIMLFQATVTGTGALYLWDGWTWFKQHSYALTSALSFLASSVFFILFLNLRENAPGWYRVALAILATWALFTLAAPLVPKPYLGATGFPLALLTCLVAFVAALHLALRGNRSARFFLIAWFFLIVGATLYVLSMSGALPRTVLTEHAQSAGLMLEAILLSIALADRINRVNAARARAQEESLAMADKLAEERAAKLEAQDRALSAQMEAREGLEQRVQDRTRELEQTLGELAEANRKLEEMSITDPLTGLRNRRHFDSELPRLAKLCNRAGQPLSVMFLDVDHFKPLNDRYGHGAGDQCLKSLARRLETSVGRSSDLLARYGGEEFVLALPSTSAERARAIAERIRAYVAQEPFTSSAGHHAITLSIGLATAVPRSATDGDRLLAAADQALYAAKGKGRNRVEVADQVLLEESSSGGDT